MEELQVDLSKLTPAELDALRHAEGSVQTGKLRVSGVQKTLRGAQADLHVAEENLDTYIQGLNRKYADTSQSDETASS